MASLERGEVAEAHVRPHDHDAVAPGLHLLLQHHRLAGGGLATGEIAPERGAVRELERGPARLRVEAEDGFVFGGGPVEIRAPDEERAGQRAVADELNRFAVFVFALACHQDFGCRISDFGFRVNFRTRAEFATGAVGVHW